jgi:hypothetical protein
MIESNFLGKPLYSESDCLMFVSKKGGYFLHTPENYSKYQGYFIFEKEDMYKSIDFVKVDGLNIKRKIYGGNFWNILYNEGIMSYYFFDDALVYEKSFDSPVRLILDCKKSYDCDEWGRNYSIDYEDGVLIVNFEKVSSTNPYKIYTAIYSDNLKYEKIENWIEKNYNFDKQRNDGFNRHVYEALKIYSCKFSLSSSLDRKMAIKSAKSAYFRKFTKRDYLKDLPEKITLNNLAYSYVLSISALKSLIVKNEKEGIFAGLPWFFQYWTRDSALSLKSISLFDKKWSKKILLEYVKNIREDGLIDSRNPKSELDSIDGVGIVFFRIYELIKEDKIKFSKKEINFIRESLDKSVNKIIERHGIEGFLVANHLESWMDTGNRQGILIEVQSLLLSMYSFLSYLYNLNNDKKNEDKYNEKELFLSKKVKEAFYKEGILADGLGDFTIKPNVFLAYYFYGKLLNNEEWERVFDNTLKNIWLSWGGVSSIDIKSEKFVDTHSGVTNNSYHFGDSWYFLNNLVAISLTRVNRVKYEHYINQILKASTEEILNKGIFGYHSELSSAKCLEANGCLAQAWSSAMYLELLNEIY